MDIVERLVTTTEAMANLCSAPMDLWNEHSNAALKAAAEITALRKRVSDLERERQAVIERIPMEYLQAHDAPGATSITAALDLPAAMKAYSEARWRLIERLKAAESAALKEDPTHG